MTRERILWQSSSCSFPLAGRTPDEAVRAFLEPLKAAASCVTAEGSVTRRTRRGDERETAAFQAGFAILERRGGQTLKLELFHRYVVTNEVGSPGLWTASTAELIYEIADQSDELIAVFHWHPENGRVSWPHLHARGMHRSLTLHKLHLPTGRVSLAAIVRFLIADLSVIPHRADWERVLDRHEQAFHRVDI